MEKKFYTLKGYQLNEDSKITTSMEDYLEMICRMRMTREFVRINELAKNLHVKPSSASKMVSNLKSLGLVSFEKYGYVIPTDKGQAIGDYLLYRHDIIHEFLCILNNTSCELEQVEKIEHFINRKTVENMKNFIKSHKKIN